MMKLGEQVLRRLLDNPELTQVEVIGVVRWLLWLQLDGEY